MADEPTWPVIRPNPKIPAVRRGTSKRRAKARGMHMSQFWAMDPAERQITYQISRAGRRPS
jgi:hypothetical protein